MSLPAPARPPRLLVVAHDWTAWHRHRQATVDHARALGWDVTVAVTADRGAEPARGVVVLPGGRGRTSPTELARVGPALVALARRLRPDVVELVTLKPIVLGTAALLGAFPGRSRPRVVATFAGLGTFLDAALSRPRHPAARVLRVLLAATRAELLCENPDDADALAGAGIARRERITVGPGVGLDPSWFDPPPPTAHETASDRALRIVQIGRVIGSKGVPELVGALRLLRDRGVAVDATLAGSLDPKNPSAIDEATVRGWEREGLVRWVGHVEPVRPVIDAADVVVLCSHREGRPRSLMEAQARAKPVVATDVPGNRQTVEHERTGLLVPLGDRSALAEALARYAADPALRQRHGAAAAEHARRRFSAAAFVATWAEVVLGVRSAQSASPRP